MANKYEERNSSPYGETIAHDRCSILLMLTANVSYTEQSIKEEIIDRCRKQMGEYDRNSKLIL